MYKYFNPIIKLEHSYMMTENYGIYLSFKDVELSALQNLLEFASETSEGKSHMDFIKSYIQSMQQHIEIVKNYKMLLESASIELLEIISSVEKLDDVLSSETFEYYLNVDIDTLYFFKPIEYDEYLKSHAYMIFEVTQLKRGYVVKQLSIGFTNKNVDEIKNEPSFIRKQIDKFSRLETLEDIYMHKDYCEELLINFFGVKNRRELLDIEGNTVAKSLLGEPIFILREIRKNSNYFGIRNQLPEHLKISFNEDLLQLIEVECGIYKKESFKDILDDEEYEEHCKYLSDRKKGLMENLLFEQHLLDEYMSYVPKEMKE